MKKYHQIIPSLLSFAPIINPAPLTTFQKTMLKFGPILSKLSFLILIIEISLIFFLFYQLIRWLKSKIVHDENKTVIFWKSIKKSLLYLIILLIVYFLIKIFYLNCRYALDYGVSIFNTCFIANLY